MQARNKEIGVVKDLGTATSLQTTAIPNDAPGDRPYIEKKIVNNYLLERKNKTVTTFLKERKKM